MSASASEVRPGASGLADLPESVHGLAACLGLARALVVVERLGGTTLPVPQRRTLQGEARYQDLAATLGPDAAAILCRVYAGTDLYIPRCGQALIRARDAALHRERDVLAAQGLSERELVARLARRFGLSDRQVWRVLKKPVSTGETGQGQKQAQGSFF